MDTVFLDTSALIKLYRPSEKGSSWLQSFTANKLITVSELVLVEAATILGRYYRDGEYTKTTVDYLYTQIQRDYNNYATIKLDIQVLQVEIMTLALPNTLPTAGNKFYIKALDAIQLTSARLARQESFKRDPTAAFTFVTADAQLLKVAAAQAFVTENPENYP